MAIRAGPVVACLAAALLFGASTPAAQHLLGQIGPLTRAGLLYLGAAAAVAPWALRDLGRLRRMGPANVRRLAASVVFGGIAAPALLMFALDRAASGSVAIWQTLEGFVTVVLAGVFFREHLGARTWIAVGAAVAANVVLAGTSRLGSADAALLVAGACLLWAIDNNVTSLLDGPTPVQTTFVKGVIAASVNLALGLAREPWQGGAPDVCTALGVGAVGYGASLVLYVGAAQQLGAARSQVIFSTFPFLGLLAAWTAFGEPVVPGQVAAALVVAAAIALMLSDRHEHEHTHEPTRHTHAHRHDDAHHDHVHEGLPASTWHTHEHEHAAVTHAHRHNPDLHHRHAH